MKRKIFSRVEKKPRRSLGINSRAGTSLITNISQICL